MDRWIHREKARYYQVDLVRDLFGDWTLIVGWGAVGSRRGQMRVIYVPSYEAGVAHLATLGKRRQRRGYHPQSINQCQQT